MDYMETVREMVAKRNKSSSIVQDEVRGKDPRPDLKDDSGLWPVVLGVAKQLDPHFNSEKSVYGALHGIRCMGGKLTLKDGKLRLEPRYGDSKVTDIKDVQDWQQLRERWLVPHKLTIKRIFREAEKQLASPQNEQQTNEIQP